jgi:hypothetical protein
VAEARPARRPTATVADFILNDMEVDLISKILKFYLNLFC